MTRGFTLSGFKGYSLGTGKPSLLDNQLAHEGLPENSAPKSADRQYESGCLDSLDRNPKPYHV